MVSKVIHPLSLVVVTPVEDVEAIVRPLGLYFVPALLSSVFTFFCLPSSSVSLSHFHLAVPMSQCLGLYSCMNSIFYLWY